MKSVNVKAQTKCVYGLVLKYISTIVLVMTCCAGVASANHQQPIKHRQQQQPFQLLSPYIGLGLGFGGEEIGRFVDSDGNIDRTYSGGGWLLEGGLSLAVDPWTHLRATAGYQFDITSRVNGDSLFDRLRFDLTMLRSFNNHQVGVGVTTHTSVGYSCTINSICDGDVEFDHAVGYTLEYALNLTDRYYYGSGQNGDSSGLSLGVRYTGIDYRSRLNNDDQLTSGSTLMGFIGVTF